MYISPTTLVEIIVNLSERCVFMIWIYLNDMYLWEFYDTYSDIYGRFEEIELDYVWLPSYNKLNNTTI